MRRSTRLFALRASLTSEAATGAVPESTTSVAAAAAPADQNLTIPLKPIPPPVSFQGSRIGPAAAALERVGPEGLPRYRPRAQYCNFMQPKRIPPTGRKSFAALSEPDLSARGACGQATTYPGAGGSGTGS